MSAFEQPFESRSGSTRNSCCLIHLVSRICFSLKEKCTSQRCICFPVLGSLIFYCVSTICGTVVEENEKTQGDRNWVFWDHLAHVEVEGGRNVGSEYVSQNSRFYLVLSVSVVPSVSVESVIESVMLL